MIGFGWMGQAHSRGCRRAPSYFPDRGYEPDLVVVSDTVAARRDDAVRSFGFQRAAADWHEVVDRPRRRRRVRHRAEHAARRDGRGRRRRRQARVLREAGRRHAGPDRRRRTRRPPRRGDHRRRLQLPLGAAGAVRQAADRRRRDRRDHQLLRPVLLDVRQRSDGAAVVAVPGRSGRPRRQHRHPQPLGRPRPLPGRRRSPRSSAPARRSSSSARCPPAAARTTTAASPATRPAR